MNKTLSVYIVNNDELNEYCALCTEISSQMAYPSFFCSGDWLKVAANNISPEDTLLLLAVKSKNAVKALLPLVSKRNVLGGRNLCFLGMDFYPDPLGIICCTSDRADCIKAVKEYLYKLSGWDRIIIDFILEDELNIWGVTGKAIAVSPYKTLENDFSALLSKLKRNNRRYLKAKVAKIKEAGIELVISRDNSTHEKLLDSLHLLHKKRAEQRNIVSSFSGLRIDALHSELIRNSDNVRFYGLHFEHQFVAIFYGFVYCNRFFAYQIAHDPDYGALGPGTALLYFAIEDCCHNGLTEFNFLQGGEEYKGIWTNDSRILYRCVLGKGTWRSKIMDGLEYGKATLKKCLVRIKRGN